jgi:hydrogenase maturation protein HypF
VGLLLPYTPVHHLLMREGLDALVMTSGNVSDEPIACGNDEAVSRLKGIADTFLMNNRDIYASCDDSVARSDAGGVRLMRRARGYVPAPAPLTDGPVVLAVGAELKGVIALTRGGACFLSRHIGDVRNEETFDYFERTVAHMKTLLGVQPEIVAHDLHPDYLTTRWAKESSIPHEVAVQHHHAHIASCMAEHGLDERVIGIALDGTGYGTDGRTWGGEFLVADRAAFERVAHFDYLPLPGGDRAVAEPWRAAFSALVDAFGEDWRKLDLEVLRRRDPRDLAAIAQMIAQGVHCPLSSGAGRVFDAVSALAGVCDVAAYEGQPAVELEAIAAGDVTDAYPFEVDWSATPAIVRFAPAVRMIVAELRAGQSARVISARFHNTVVAAAADVTQRIARETGLRTVCLSGGVFQNRYLCDHLVPRLAALGLDAREQASVPPNDGGIALGQAAVARRLLS